MLFDGSEARLPTATLLASAGQARRRVIAADLDRWLAMRWDWLRPRTVPLLAAFVGLLVTLGAVKYLVVYAYSDNLALQMRARVTATRPMPRTTSAHCPGARPTREPVQILVEPIAPGDPYIELTFAPADAP